MNRPDAVVAPVEHEPGLLQALVEVGVDPGHLLVHRDLERVHDPVGDGGEDQVGELGRHAVAERPFGVEVTEGQLHQRVRAGDVRRRALDHRDVGAVLPQGGADVVGRVVRPEHDALATGVRRAVRVRAGVLDLALRTCSAPGISGTLGTPDMPVAITSCFGLSTTCSVVPSSWRRTTSTVHSPASSSYRALGGTRWSPSS